jgi:hypothetical protein
VVIYLFNDVDVYKSHQHQSFLNKRLGMMQNKAAKMTRKQSQ